MAATLDDVLSELKNLRADVEVIGEHMTEVQAAAVAVARLPEELKLLRQASQALADAVLRVAGDHEGRLQIVEKRLGLR